MQESPPMPPSAELANQLCTVALSFGLPRQSSELKQAARDIEKKANAENGTARSSIYYFKKNDPKNPKRVIDGLQSLKTFQGEWKRKLEHYARYPYIGGLKIIPAVLVADFLKASDDFKANRETIWMNWADEEYPVWAEEAPTRMGQYYDADDFPSLGDCMKRFVCDVDILPMAAGEQWKHLSAIGSDITAVLAASTDEKIQEAKEQAMVSMWQDMMEPVQHIVDTLGKDSPKIYETLIGNVLSIVDIVPAYASQADPKLVELAAQAKAQLGNITTEQLRKSDDVRKETLQKAKDLVNAFQPFARKLSI